MSAITDAAREGFAQWRELARLVRYAQARAAVRWHLWHLERERIALAKAYDAVDRARAELLQHETPPRRPPSTKTLRAAVRMVSAITTTQGRT